MKLQEYGSVAKASIYSALGFARNYKESDCSSCRRCQHYETILRMAAQQGTTPEKICGTLPVCTGCQKQKSIYINEANRYGSDKGRLNAGSVLLYLYLHLCSPTGNGVISSFSVAEASRFLGCDHKSVHANLNQLVDQNYILYAKTNGRGLYTVMILSYADAFKSAKEGGRGFITISKELLEKGLLPERRSINLLRVDLRAYMDIDNGDLTKTSSSKTMEQLRYVLPEYLRPGTIHSLITQTRTLYDVKVKEQYSFFLNPQLNAKKNKLEKREQALLLLEEFLTDINTCLSQKREGTLSLTTVPKQYIPILVTKIKTGHLDNLILSKEDFDDILQMSVQYSYSEVFSLLIELLSSEKTKTPYAPQIRNMIQGADQAAA